MGKTKTEMRPLMCRLSEQELEEQGKALTDLLQEKAELEISKSSSARHYSDAIKAVDVKIEKQIPIVRDREIEREVVVERWPEETTAEEPVPNVVLAQDEEATSSADDYTHRLELIVKLYRTRSEAACDAVCDRLLPELYADEEE